MVIIHQIGAFDHYVTASKQTRTNFYENFDKN